MIYFIRAGSAVKIGYVINRGAMPYRLVDLQCGCPLVLNVLGVTDGEKDREGELHDQFADERYLGEWFRITPRIIEFIETECRPFITTDDRGNLISPSPNARTRPSLPRLASAFSRAKETPEQDTLLRKFIEERISPGLHCQATVIHKHLKAFCDEIGSELPLPSMKILSSYLAASGFTSFKRGGLIYYRLAVSHAPEYGIEMATEDA